MIKNLLSTSRKSWLAGVVLALLLLGSSNAWAQVAGGTYTIDTGQPYPTLTAAMTAINAQGISGSVILELSSTYSSASETFPITYTLATSGANTVTIRPQAGATGRSITGLAASTSVFSINGGKNLIIDGRPGGTGTTADLTVSGLNTAGSTIQFTSNANTNTVQYCQVKGIANSITSGVIVFTATATAAGGGNSNNTIQNNKIGDGATTPANLIYSIGLAAAGAGNSSNTVASNELFNFYSATANAAAIYLSGTNTNGNTAWTITGNSLYQTATRTATSGNTYYGIFIGTGAGYTITGNFIGGAAAGAASGTFTLAGGVANRFVGISGAFTTGTASSLQGNTMRRISLTTSSGATTTYGIFSGIYITSGDVSIGTITANSVGDASVANSITVAGSTGGALINGIDCTSTTGTVNISNNMVANMSLTISSALLYGIQASNSTVTAANNTISTLSIITSGTSASNLYGYYNLGSPTVENLTGNAITGLNISGTGTSTGHLINGIRCNTASADVQQFNQNAIANLAISGSGSGAVSGILVLGNGGAVGSTLNRNKIYNLSASGAGGTVFGLSVGIGSWTVSNNIIGDLRTPAATSTLAIAGIIVPAGTAINAYYNTIYLTATSTGASFGTSGIYLSSTTPVVNLRNNIVVNKSTPGTTSGLTVALRRTATGVTGYASTSNNNLYYAGPAGAARLLYSDGTNAYQTIASFKAGASISPRETSSVAEDAPFLSTTGTDATFLHIDPSVATQIESGGQAISGITTDFDGDTRNATTPDIGADEGTFTPNDLSAPLITYTALTATGSTADRTLSVTITDASGIATGAGAPLIYFRKGTSGAYFSGVATANTGSSYTFTISSATLGGLVAGDVVQYYVAAQDASANNNATTSPSAGSAGTNPPGSTPPTTPNQYTILTSLSGTYYVTATVGSSPTPAREYPTLTAAVAAYNTSGLGGAVTFLLLDPTYSTGETFPIAVLNNVDASATNTLTIRPSNATGTTAFAITGSATTAILQLLASDYVTIDGSLGGTISATDLRPSRNLTITNTSTNTASYVVQQFAQFTNDGATNNTIKNLVAVGSSTSGTTGTLYGIALLGASTATTANQYTNNTVQNCAVRAAQVGIVSIGGAIGLKNQNVVITQNDLNATGTGALTTGGIISAFDNNGQITLNTVGNIPTGAYDIFGISLGFGGFSNTTFTGSETTNTLVSRNSIGVISNTSTYSAIGIGVATATTGANTVANNFVTGVLSNGTGADFGAGIFVNGSAGGGATRVLYNSVSMTGTTTGGSRPGFALAVGGSLPTIEIRNNVLYNSQSTGGTSYALGLAYAGTTGSYAGLTSTNNAFFAATGVGLTGSLATGTARATLTDLNTETGQDRPTTATAPVGTSFTLAASPFSSATDLHTSFAALNMAGTPIAGITTDIDGDARDASTPDIGGDEFTPSTLDIKPVALLSPTAAQLCFGAAEVLTVQIQNAAIGPVDFSVNNATVTVVVTPPTGPTQSFTATLTSGTLATGTNQSVVLPGSLNMSALGAYSFAVTATVAGDGNTSNDVLAPAATRTNAAPVALPYTEPFNSSTLPTNFSAPTFSLTTSANNGGAAGSYGLRVNIYSAVTVAAATTPMMGPTPSANSTLTFDARFLVFGSSSGYTLTGTDRVDVQVAGCDGLFTTIYTINSTNFNGTGTASGSFYTYTVPLMGIGTGQRLQVRLAAAYGSTSGDFNVDVDNLNVRSLFATDLAATALVAPLAVQSCYSAAETVTVTVKNQGIAALDFAANPGTVTVSVTGGTTATLTAALSSGTLAAGATQNVTLPTTLDMTATGAYTFGISATVTGDQNTANDALTPAPTRTVVAPAVGTLSASVASFCNSGSSTVSLASSANGTVAVQISTDNLNFTDIAGATLPYATGTLTQTTYYRVQVRCATTTTSNVVAISKTAPNQAITTPVTACEGTSFMVSVTGTGGTGGVSGARTESPVLAIPDNSAAVGASSQITLSGAGTATLSAASTIKVTLNLTHTFDADLDMFLVSPDGTKAMLLSADNGSTGDNYTNTVLLTGATPSITTGTAPFTGTFGPQGSITTAPDRTGASSNGGTPSGTYNAVIPAAALAGSLINGTWTLRVFDDLSGDTGTLNSWSLDISDPGIAPVYTHTVTGPGTVSAVTYSGTNNATGTVTVTGAPAGSNTYTIGTAASGSSSCVASSTRTVAVTPAATATAGTTPAGICAGTTYSTTGSFGGSATSATYTSSGSGTFSNGGVITATTTSVTYTPSAADITAGSVSLTLTTTGPCADVTSTLPLTISSATTYTGAATGDGTNWFNAANWTACVPSSTVDALIPTGLTNYPSLTTGTAEVRTLTLANGGSLAQSAGTLNVYGDLTSSTPAANVTLTGGTVAFLGATPTVTGLSGLYDLTVNLSSAAGTLTLANNATVNHALTLTQGTLTTGTYAVALAPTATVTETDASYVLGQVSVPGRNLATATAETFGGIGLTLTPDAASAAFPGLTTVVRTTGTVLTGVGTSVSIKRSFDIEPATNTGLNVAMDFSYFDHERNGIAAGNVALFKSVSGPSGPWANQQPITIAGNTVSKTGITDFSIWTLGSATNPLPVELTAFTADRQGSNAALAWTTATEKSSRGFEVQMSTDGRTFRVLDFVASATPTSTSPRSYSYLDREAGKTGLRYYRLRQLDVSGAATFSPVRTVRFGDDAAAVHLTAAPNPFRERLMLTVELPANATAAPAQLTLTDATGRTLLKQTTPALPAGLSQLELPDLAKLTSGVYIVNLAVPGQTIQHLKVVKE